MLAVIQDGSSAVPKDGRNVHGHLMQQREALPGGCQEAASGPIPARGHGAPCVPPAAWTSPPGSLPGLTLGWVPQVCAPLA